MKAKGLKDFKKDEVINELKKFRITHNPISKIVNAYVGKNRVSSYRPNKHYQIFDFGNFAINLIDHLVSKKVMKINKYNLEMKGIQELRLYGDVFTIDYNGRKEEHYEQLSILNSTNGKRRFSAEAGIFRFVCSNGAILSLSEVGMINVRHYKSNEQLNELINLNFSSLKLDSSFSIHKNAIQKLAQEEITLVDLKNRLFREYQNSNTTAKFFKRLLNSKTDKIDSSKLSLQAYKGLSSINSTNLDILDKNEKLGGITIDKYKAFQVGTEEFRSNDSGIIKAKSDQIYRALTVE